LAWTLVAKTVAHGAFTDGLAARGIVPDRVMTTPAPLTSLLWMGVADAGDTLWVGHTGLLDDGPPRDFVAVPRRAQLLAGHERDRGVHNLEWFSKGWWVAERGPDGSLFLNDLRFGRTDGYLQEEGDYVFRWRLVARDGRYVSHEQVQPEMRVSREAFARLYERIRYGPQ